jgi:hypothetical protein
MLITSNNIQELKENEVFVFGSNLAGIHGAGAAKLAYKKFGANWGHGFGFSNNRKTFAIPTKDETIQTLSLNEIEKYIELFEFSAVEQSDFIFLVTEIGCGLAGFSPKDIAPLFKKSYSLHNVYMPQRFWEVIK